MTHLCHANGCGVPVPPRMLMCKRHWFMVPKAIRDQVWATYRPGQEVTKDPSPEYLAAMRRALGAAVQAQSQSPADRRPAMTEPTASWLDRDEIKARHSQFTMVAGTDGGYHPGHEYPACRHCREPWPCDAIRALTALEQAERAQDSQWQQIEEAHARIIELTAEIDRLRKALTTLEQACNAGRNDGCEWCAVGLAAARGLLEEP